MAENSTANNSDANGAVESTSLTTAAQAIGGGAGTAAGTATNLAQTAQEYSERITDAAAQAKDYVAGKASVVGTRFKELQTADIGELTDTARQYARKNPGQAILISAAAGLLLGLLLRSGRR